MATTATPTSRSICSWASATTSPRTSRSVCTWASGANAANCYGGEDAKGNCLLSDNFTVTNIDLSFAYLFRIAERLYIAPKLKAGWTLLDPAPALNGNGGAITNAPNVGAAVGIEYATNMDHFTIGLDWVFFNIVLGPNIISMQFIPRVKYTF